MFLLQIKVYSEFGGKPQTWDQHQKGTTNYEYNIIFFSLTLHSYVNWSWAQYVFVSLSLALVIAKFFPAVHNQIVSRATRLEHQSLYWGTAVVSNVFTYGLFFAAMRGGTIFEQFMYNMQILVSYNPLYIASAHEVIINVILFVGSVIASLKTHPDADVPIPRGMAKVIIKLSFCWSCFCCCVCCSPRCRAKTMRVLILFSFMSFVYRSVMDAISVAFALFIEESRVTTITLSIVYISFLLFLILFVSFSLLGLLRSRNNDVLCCQSFITCFRSICIFVIIFPAIVLTLVMYTMIIISLNLRGVTGIVTGLIPSIALSAASWYLKNRLVKEVSQSNTGTSMSQYTTTDGAVNDGEREETGDNSDDQRMLLP